MTMSTSDRKALALGNSSSPSSRHVDVRQDQGQRAMPPSASCYGVNSLGSAVAAISTRL